MYVFFGCSCVAIATFPWWRWRLTRLPTRVLTCAIFWERFTRGRLDKNSWKFWKRKGCCPEDASSKQGIREWIPVTDEARHHRPFLLFLQHQNCLIKRKEMECFNKKIDEAKQKKVSASTNMAQIFTGGRSGFFFAENFLPTNPVCQPQLFKSREQ